MVLSSRKRSRGAKSRVAGEEPALWLRCLRGVGRRGHCVHWFILGHCCEAGAGLPTGGVEATTSTERVGVCEGIGHVGTLEVKGGDVG